MMKYSASSYLSHFHVEKKTGNNSGFGDKSDFGDKPGEM